MHSFFSPRRKPHYNISYSQNFIKSQKLAIKIVDLMKIKPTQLIIEIGPGKGALTTPLVHKTKNVIAIEQDKELSEKLLHNPNLRSAKIINQDFLKFPLPYNQDYKVVGNIPFALTTKITQKIINTVTPPSEAYLILQKEAAERLIDRKFYGLTLQPWFEFKIIYYFNKDDFHPKPDVDAVLLRIHKYPKPFVPLSNKVEYLDFLAYCFVNSRVTLRVPLKRLFTFNQLRIIQKSIAIDSTFTDLSLANWIFLFNIFRTKASADKKGKVMGCYRRLKHQQSKLRKDFKTRKKS